MWGWVRNSCHTQNQKGPNFGWIAGRRTRWTVQHGRPSDLTLAPALWRPISLLRLLHKPKFPSSDGRVGETKVCAFPSDVPIKEIVTYNNFHS